MVFRNQVYALAPGPLRACLTRSWSPASGTRVAVAVSGGSDSTALLFLLAGMAPGRGWDLVVATLDHGMRGAEGAADQEFVLSLAREIGLPCVSRSLTLPVPPGGSGESAAREARHQFFREAARETGAGAVALGHTLDDQVETVLHRLGRGAGLRGLGGMRRYSPPLWRPLLEVRRSFLQGLLRRAGRAWREDSTNTSPAATRNRLRCLVLPALEKALGPASLANIARASALAREDEEFLEKSAREALSPLLLAKNPEQVELDRRLLIGLPSVLSRRILRFLLEDLTGGRTAGASHLEGLLTLARAGQSGTTLHLPGGAEGIRKAGTLVLRLRKETRDS